MARKKVLKWFKRTTLGFLALLALSFIGLKTFHHFYNKAAEQYWQETCDRVERELGVDLSNPPESSYHLLHEDIRTFIEDEDGVHIGSISSLELEDVSEHGWHPFEMQGYQLTQLFDEGAFEAESEAAEYLLSILVEQHKSIKVIEEAIDRKEVFHCDVFNPDKIQACFFQQSVCSYLGDRAVIQAISGDVNSALKDLGRASYFLDENSQNPSLVGLLLYESCRFKLIRTATELSYRRIILPEELSEKIINSTPNAKYLECVFAGEVFYGHFLLTSKDSPMRSMMEESQSFISSVREALDLKTSDWDTFINRLTSELVLIATPAELLKAQFASIHNVYLDRRGDLEPSMLSMDSYRELSHYEVYKPEIIKRLDFIGGGRFAKAPMLAIYGTIIDMSASKLLYLKVLELEKHQLEKQRYPATLPGDTQIYGEEIVYTLAEDKQSYELSIVLPSDRDDVPAFQTPYTIPMK